MLKITNVTTTNIQDKQIHVMWDIIINGLAQYYEIERSFGNDIFYKLKNNVWTDPGQVTSPDQLSTNYYLDVGITGNYQYRVRYFNTTENAYSEYSYSGLVGTTIKARIGYTFNNYKIPTGKWGKVLTADDMRYTYLFGINCKSDNGAEYTDEQFDFFVDAAIQDWEQWLNISIKRRKIMCDVDNLGYPTRRILEWSENQANEEYNVEDDVYPFKADDWRDSFGSLKLNYCPVINITRCEMLSETHYVIKDLLDWIRLDKSSGLVTFYPKANLGAFGPFSYGTMFMRTLYAKGYPHGFRFTYEAGYESSDFVPSEIRQIIGQWASVRLLDSIGDGLLAGFSSSSISLDGLSESFSSTQSPMNTYFGARIRDYYEQCKEWYEKNKYRYAMPISFMGD